MESKLVIELRVKLVSSLHRINQEIITEHLLLVRGKKGQM